MTVALEISHRPWGHYEVLLDDPELKVKRIVVKPGQRLSLQRHQQRREHWFVAAGTARVTLDEQELDVAAGGSLDIPLGSWHRVANLGPTDLVLVEAQTGSYFGEDDIERREDDYGRLEG
ncbi:MAG: phosphomannose isomerase type II C-terminal cupin domain [Candidatus Delongbacteria bacterium]